MIKKRVTIKKEKNKKQIILVVDESGSMSADSQEFMDVMNNFLEEQRNIKGKLTVELIKFSDVPTLVSCNKDIKEFENFSASNYNPRGMTALYDAVGLAINRARELKNESKKPLDVLIAVLTDGKENSSMVYNRERLSYLMDEFVLSDNRDKILFLCSDLGTSFDDVKCGGVLSTSNYSEIIKYQGIKTKKLSDGETCSYLSSTTRSFRMDE